ncbi:MAG: hypothetical protein AB7V48_01950 [Sedimentibacter sp.]
MFENDIEYDRTCQNCGSFFQDPDDMDFGVCMNDEAFEPYADEIVENENFSCCYDLFLQKRYDGLTEACELFEEVEFIGITDDEDINSYLHYEVLKNQNVDEIINSLYSGDVSIVKNALNLILLYVNIGNESAYEGLLKYYISLGPAESLDDVYIRKDIINMFSRYESERRTIEAYVNELERTPSNNTTRQLYSLILERLTRCNCNYNIVVDLLNELLCRKEFGNKIYKRITEVMDYISYKEFY